MALISLTDESINEILDSLGYGDEGPNSITGKVKDAQEIMNSYESSDNEKFIAKSLVNTYEPVTENIKGIRNSIKESINNTVDEINTKFEDVENFAKNTINKISEQLTNTFSSSALGFSSMSSVTFTVTTTTGVGTSLPVPPTAFSGGVASQISNINSQVENTKSTLVAQLKQKTGFLKEITTKLNSISPYLSVIGIDISTIVGPNTNFGNVTNLLTKASDLINNLPTLSI